MTKQKALSLAKYLSAQCDQPHIFVARAGSGCMCDVVTNGDAKNLLTMFFTLIDRTMHVLNSKHRDGFQKVFAGALLTYLKEEFEPEPVEENLTDKQRRKRRKANELIISQIEEVL